MLDRSVKSLALRLDFALPAFARPSQKELVDTATRKLAYQLAAFDALTGRLTQAVGIAVGVCRVFLAVEHEPADALIDIATAFNILSGFPLKQGQLLN